MIGRGPKEVVKTFWTLLQHRVARAGKFNKKNAEWSYRVSSDGILASLRRAGRD